MTEHKRRPLRRAWYLVAITCVPGLLLAACNKSETATDNGGPGATQKPANSHTQGPADATTKPTDGGSVVMGIEGEAEGLDPRNFAFAASGHYLASAVYDPLASQDENGKAVPYLATAIEPSDGNKTWTITLPQGVTFHDGSPLDAAAVKANLDGHRNGLITKLAFQSVTDVQAPDTTHVVVKLDQPWAAFTTVMTSQLGYVMAPAMLQDAELAKKPIGSGPYVFDAHVDGESWKFKKNPKYRRPGLPHLDSLEFRIIPDETQRVAELDKGTIDMLHAYKPDPVTTIKASSYKVVDYSEGEEDFLILNTQKPPFDNLNARKAVAYATDTGGWIKEITKGVEKPANSPFAPGQLGYEADNGYPTFDLAKAKEYAQKYQDETGKPLEFSMLAVDTVNTRADMQYFKQRYDQAGWKVSLNTMTQLQMVAQTATGNYDLSQFRNFGFRDPDTDTPFWRSTSALDPGQVSLNFPHYRDPAVDAAIGKALASSNDGERDAAYKELGRIWADKLPYVWLGRPNWVLAARPRVNGTYAAANGSVQTLGGKTWLADLWVNRSA